MSAAWFGLGYGVGVLMMAGVYLAGLVHWHRWSKWRHIKLVNKYSGGVHVEVSGQIRTCSRCGKERVREVAS